MSQGKELTYEQKQAIVAVKSYMDYEKSKGSKAFTFDPAVRRAKALNFSISAVKNVLSEWHRNKGILERFPSKPRGHGQQLRAKSYF